MSVNVIRFKALISSLLLLSFIVLVFTGIGLYFAPSGKLAKTTDWNFFGLDKWTLEDIHTKAGFVFALLVVIHFILNFKTYRGEIYCSFKA